MPSLSDPILLTPNMTNDYMSSIYFPYMDMTIIFMNSQMKVGCEEMLVSCNMKLKVSAKEDGEINIIDKVSVWKCKSVFIDL